MEGFYRSTEDSEANVREEVNLMKAVWYLLTVIAGAIGALSLLRFLELQLTLGGFFPIPLVLAVLFLVAAWQALLKARAS